MFKQSMLIAFFFVATSCGQNSHPAVERAINDRVDVSSGTEIADTTVKPSSTTVVAKHDAYNQDIKDLPPSLAHVVPEGYTALDTASGDLNLDSCSDMIMVLKKNGEDTTSDVVEHPEKRPLLILLGQVNNSFRLAARNDNAVYCIDCGGMMGDPFMDVVIKKGYFSIEHYGGSGWRWTRTTTFKYSPEDNYWYLHEDSGDRFHAAEPEKVTTKVRTTKDFGRIPFDKFDIYKGN